MPQENTDVDPFDEYFKNYREPVEDDKADYTSLRAAELAHLKVHDEPLAAAISKLIVKHPVDDRGAYKTLNSASNAYLFDDNLERIVAREEKDIKTYLYNMEVESWTLLNRETAIGVLDQLKATCGNPHIWHVENDEDPEGLQQDINAAWDDLYELTCQIWDGAHEEWADTSDVSGIDLSLKHNLFTSCPRADFQEAMRWVAHQPENEGPARDFIFLMMGVFELAWVDYLKHR